MSNSSGTATLITLPIEVLVYIVSFLSTREKIGIRCVSKCLNSVSEVPSLWKEFIWSRYAPRDEKLLVCVIKVFGKHFKKFHFTDHIAPSKIQAMLKHCKNVEHLSLPSFNYNTFEKLEKTINGLSRLQVLSISHPTMYPSCKLFIQKTYMLSTNLKEVSLHYGQISIQELLYVIQRWLKGWANCNYLPEKVNIVYSGNSIELCSVTSYYQSCISIFRNTLLPTIRNSSHIAWFNIFSRSIDFSPVIPMIQLQITESSVILPSVKASNYGILGLDHDTIHLTQGNYCGKRLHKASLTGTNNEYINASVVTTYSLTSVTHFDVSHCNSLYPGHLEQLSLACPNLRRLDLCSSSNSLNNMLGLHSIADNCNSLQELNLCGITITNPEYCCVQLWEVLCKMHLIHLAIESWMINVHDSSEVSLAVKQQKLINMFQNFTSLKVLEVRGTDKSVPPNNTGNELFIISYFPSISSYKIFNLPSNNSYHSLRQIFSCKYLKCLFLYNSLPKMLSLCLEDHCSSLQQLCIHSRDTVLTETFIDTLCSHGSLEHVILCVESLSAKSINSIIEQSPHLVELQIFLRIEVFLISQLLPMIATIKSKFSKRKLFKGGCFNIRQHVDVNENLLSVLKDTNLLSVWDYNNYYIV